MSDRELGGSRRPLPRFERELLTNPGTPASKDEMVAAFERSLPTQAEFHEAISSRSDRWFSACLRITRNPELAEDAVQEALLSAWHKRHQFQHEARLDTW